MARASLVWKWSNGEQLWMDPSGQIIQTSSFEKTAPPPAVVFDDPESHAAARKRADHAGAKTVTKHSVPQDMMLGA